MLQKLEDKVITLVEELEADRNRIKLLAKETYELKHENNELKARLETDKEKLKNIVNLIDSIDATIETSLPSAEIHHLTSESMPA